MATSENIDFIIKNAFIFIIFSSVIFSDFIYIKINKRKKHTVEIDNEFKTNLYENDISFIKYQTKLKPIALYHPEYNNISYLKFFKKNKSIKKFIADDIEKLITEQTKLAKNHGIYGFAIYYDLFNFNSYVNKIFNFFSNKGNFPFFLIWKNDQIKYTNIETIEQLINNLKKYIISDDYIRIREKPVLSISNPNNFYNTRSILTNIRNKAKQYSIGEIFIFYPFTGNFSEKKFLKDYDAAYDFSNIDLIEHIIIKPNILYYSGIIYKNLILNKLNFNFALYRSCSLNQKKFNDFNPEKFYIANNLIFEWENNNFNKSGGILFIDSWNNYNNGKYLEPDKNYGYASINSFSKSIFNLPFQINFNYNILHNITIAIQIHVYYEDLLMEIINKLNLISVKYDLFISTISETKKQYIKNCLKSSNANNYEIKIFNNQGRDVFPFVNQMRSKFEYYKYICHIHTKKSNHKSLLGANWRNYIYSNLIGSKNIVLEILLDFENNDKLGFIFPEIYYDLKKDIFGFDFVNFDLNKQNKKYMDFILQKIFGAFKVGEKLDFPAGNMFWAKTKAIYQIFNIRLKYPKELNQTNGTIMHGIERIWLYLVKLNGYYYKTIFKHY